MRTIGYFLLIAFLFAGCKSAEKLMLQGNYDKAIEKSLKKAVKGKAKNEDYILLDKAYRLANTRDNEYIESLLAEAKPENWDRIYRTYVRLDARQKRVRIALPFTMNGQTINYEQIDYAQLKADSKNSAANYYYNHGNKLLEQGSKSDARQAYQQYNRAKNYNESAFPDIDFKLDTASKLGTTYVNIITTNKTKRRWRTEVYDALTNYDIAQLESFWVDYIVGDNTLEIDYDYSIAVQISRITFSSEKESTTETNKKKKIEDGYVLKKDRAGKVMKDSLGNNIKIPKYKEVTCKYRQTIQYKDIKVNCNLEYYDIKQQTVVKNIPFEVVTVFEHISAIALGNEMALEPEEREYLKNKPISFPSANELLLDAANEINVNVNYLLKENKKLIW